MNVDVRLRTLAVGWGFVPASPTRHACAGEQATGDE